MTMRRILPAPLSQGVRLVWESSPGWTVASAGLLLVQTALGLAALGLVKLVIDAITAGLADPHRMGALDQVAIFIGLAAAVAVLSALCSSAARLINEIQGGVVADHLHSVLHAKSVEVDLEYYENSHYYDTLHRAQHESPGRATTLVTNLLQLGSSGISLAAIAGLLMAFNWWLGVALVAGAAPGALVRIRYAGELYRWQQRRTATERRAGYFSWMLTSGFYAPEIRLFDLGGLFSERFRTLRGQLRQERQEIAVRQLTRELAAQLGATAAVYGAYGFIAYQVLAGSITLGDLVMYHAAFLRAQGNLRDLLGGLTRFYEDNLLLRYLSDFLKLERKVAEPARPRPVPRPLREGIVLEHVDFRYPGANRLALEDVSLAIRPGERIALVGQNGSGKTTLVKLLCRLYDPSGGRITVDGVPLPCFAQAEWRREVGVLFQDPVQYHVTARENIWFGNRSPLSDDEPIIRAARRAGAHPVIERLPQGYDTALGKWLEDGSELSTGEWQRIALARTYLRDAQLVILDEPSSAMDALAEQALLQTFLRVADGRTTIFISHRLSAARLADRIYVLAEGRLVESGAHDELMCRGGAYAELFSAQAHHYQMKEAQAAPSPFPLPLMGRG